MSLNEVHNNNMYSAVQFPAYSFVEFPKVVTLKDGSTAIANNKSHELQLIATDSTESVNPESTSERDALLAHIKKQELEMADLRAQMNAKASAQITIQTTMPPKEKPAPVAKPTETAPAKPTLVPPASSTVADLLK